MGDFWPISGGKTPLTELLKKDNQKAEQLDKLAVLLELHFKDMQDIEFIVEESGNIIVIQTR